MAPSRKNRGEIKTCAPPPEEPTPWKLPMDLLLEIIARSNPRTLVRCAATCRLLRRRILKQPYFQQAAPCILVYLWNDARQPLSLVHPTTPAALSLCYKHLARFISRRFATLLDKYKPVSSRHGLVVLVRRQSIEKRPRSADRCFDMCLYDPMSGVQTFFSDPPDSRGNQYSDPKYVVLTAADGIGMSFMLLVFDRERTRCCVVRVRRSVSLHDTTTWKCVWYGYDRDFPWESLKTCGDPTILKGGILYWLPCRGNKITSFDLGTEKLGSSNLPPTNSNVKQLYLATSSDRKLLKLFAVEGFMMYVWLQLPVSVTGGSGWSLETVIDMEEKLRSLDPNITGGPCERIEFEGSGKSTGEVVFLIARGCNHVGDAVIVFDLETNKMQKKQLGLQLLEVDMSSRLQVMKKFDSKKLAK